MVWLCEWNGYTVDRMAKHVQIPVISEEKKHWLPNTLAMTST